MPGARGLIIAAAASLLGVLTALPAARAHDWYRGLLSRRGDSCCDERDCRPVPYRPNAQTGREEIKANGRWWPVDYDVVLGVPTPDGGAHACWNKPRGRPNFRCVILPGMAGLDLPGGGRLASAGTARPVTTLPAGR
jgi:hypothetical protein